MDREIDELKKNISPKNISTQVKYDRIVIQRLFRFNPPVYRKFFKDCSKLVVNAIFVVGRKTGLQIKNYEFLGDFYRGKSAILGKSSLTFQMFGYG